MLFEVERGTRQQQQQWESRNYAEKKKNFFIHFISFPQTPSAKPSDHTKDSSKESQAAKKLRGECERSQFRFNLFNRRLKTRNWIVYLCSEWDGRPSSHRARELTFLCFNYRREWSCCWLGTAVVANFSTPSWRWTSSSTSSRSLVFQFRSQRFRFS